MTKNYKEFETFVKGKFESMSNFSKIITGSFMSLQGLQHSKDIERVDDLFVKARLLRFDIDEVELSDFDRLIIKNRMKYLLENSELKTVGKWLTKNNISYFYYSAVTSGRLKRKNCAYENLLTKMKLK